MTFRILYFLTYRLLSLLAHLPLNVLYWISDVLYVACYYLVGYRRRVVRKNLALAFPEYTSQQKNVIERAFYRHLCDCIVETIKLLHISDAELQKRIKVLGSELVEQAADAGSPVIIFLGHYGNWEWVPQVTRSYVRPTVSGQIYRPLSSQVVDALMLRIRSCFHTRNIPQKRAVRTLLRMRQEYSSFLIGFIADQRPNSTNLKHWCMFMGQDTAFNPGGEDIGQRIGACYLYLDIEKQDRGYYRMTFKELSPLDDGEAYPYTRAFLKEFEQTLHRAPAYWLWSHNRWKFTR